MILFCWTSCVCPIWRDSASVGKSHLLCHCACCPNLEGNLKSLFHVLCVIGPCTAYQSGRSLLGEQLPPASWPLVGGRTVAMGRVLVELRAPLSWTWGKTRSLGAPLPTSFLTYKIRLSNHFLIPILPKEHKDVNAVMWTWIFSIKEDPKWFNSDAHRSKPNAFSRLLLDWKFYLGCSLWIIIRWWLKFINSLVHLIFFSHFSFFISLPRRFLWHCNHL